MQSDDRFDRLILGNGAVVPENNNYNPRHARRFRKKRSKLDVLQAARDALVLSDEFMSMANRFQKDAADLDDELTQEYLKPYYPNKSAVLESLKTHPRQIALTTALRIAQNAYYYVYTVFILTYLAQGGISRETGLTAVLVASALGLVTVPLWGWLSDVFGRRRVYLFGAVSSAVASKTAVALPFQAMAETYREQHSPCQRLALDFLDRSSTPASAVTVASKFVETNEGLRRAKHLAFRMPDAAQLDSLR